MLVGLISENFLFKNLYSDDWTDSIGSNDAVIFLNPVKYTIDQNDLNYHESQMSAFDDEIHEECTSLNKDEEVVLGEVTRGITLGCKDKR